MFSQHPFTLGHRYALAVRPALPLWKRVVDLLCCVVILPVLGVLTFSFAVVASISAKGPIFYRQENVGFMGRRFWIYRFRTLRVVAASNVVNAASASESAEPQPTSFVPGGQFLRTTGLADLPQIVNVLRGEMSIVGPRPFLVSGSGRVLDVNGPTVVPGITGLWRVRIRGEASKDDVMRWERTYGETMAFGTDIALIARTVLAAFGFRSR
jgi:lipopolysaccharide/colanic/teichoic acid biosynthesis glycosyltransferase